MGVTEMATPICRCRVLYLGSAVPHITKDGLQGIQEPLRELYPDQAVVGARGIDSWLSVWSNGLLLENVDERGMRVTRFFPVATLHYCAAVRHVVVPGADGERVPRFLPLDSPFARLPTGGKPPLFACILRRTTGIKVLECHAFICKKEMAANALVRCCFHAYADNMYARQLENGGSGSPNSNGTGGTGTPGASPSPSEGRRSGNSSFGRLTEWRETNGNHHLNVAAADHNNSDLVSLYNGPGDTENHKVWPTPPQSRLENHKTATHNGGPRSPTPQLVQLTAGDNQSALYGEIGSRTLSSVKSFESQRAQRPRQMILPSAKPPPPPELIHDPPATSGHPAKARRTPPLNGHGPPRMHHHVHPSRVPPMAALPPRGPFPPFIMARSAEEPAYMPTTARPLSPVASYQPGAFPYDRYYMQPHTGTHPRPPPGAKYKKTGGGKKTTGQVTTNGSSPGGSGERNNGSDSESKYSTGIYRKKGHLNERAFSYSIRQEHRSRSHSSLATLTFNGQGSPEPAPANNKPAKNPGKQQQARELTQLVSEISLSEDDTDDEGPFAPKANSTAINGNGIHNNQNGNSHSNHNGNVINHSNHRSRQAHPGPSRTAKMR